MNKAASVEVSSEDENHPIESALLGDEKRGWRAAEPGSQTIRLLFDGPQRLRRIWLAFEDNETVRTQEFVLRWSSHVGQPFREIVRQQWNFSSPGAVREIEDYAVDLLRCRSSRIDHCARQGRCNSGNACQSPFSLVRALSIVHSCA